ncbi:MAG: aldose 1-epimerase [Candidatus Binatia bacterium]
MKHSITEPEIEGYPGYRLESEDAQVTATFVPGAGMVGTSLTHKGEELLVQENGLKDYVERGATFGIPLLHPWGNRLESETYKVEGKEVDLKLVAPLVARDPNGLPIHGLGAGRKEWTVTEVAPGMTCARLTAILDIDAGSSIFPGFPFPHRLQHVITLAGATPGACLSIETKLTATGKPSVPVVFGWHPYFHLPGVKRKDWIVDLPVRRHYRLNTQNLPTKEREPVVVEKEQLGNRIYDDLFDKPVAGNGNQSTFTLEGGNRKLAVCFEFGYPYAIVWAPADRDLICFEPMTAATNALATGWPELITVAPDESYIARFSIFVS